LTLRPERPSEGHRAELSTSPGRRSTYTLGLGLRDESATPAATGDDLDPHCQRLHVRACQLAPDMAYDQQACARLEPLTFYLPGKTPKEVSGYTLGKHR
jgi:hypothetical protein